MRWQGLKFPRGVKLPRGVEAGAWLGALAGHESGHKGIWQEILSKYPGKPSKNHVSPPLGGT